MAKKADLSLIWLLIGVAAFHVWTMPRMYYSGDNFAPRVEASHLLNTGELGLPYAKKTEKMLAGFFEFRGQYFFENDRKQRFFSKYGVGYTALYLFPLALDKWVFGETDAMANSKSQIFFIDILQIFLSLVTAAYLYWIAGLYAKKKSRRIWFVLLTFYATFVWHYLRAPTHEVFQIFPFVGFYYHMIRFWRLRKKDENMTQSFKQLLFAVLCVCFLLFLKLFFGLLLAVGGLFALCSGGEDSSLSKRILNNLKSNFIKYALIMGIPTAVTLGLIMWGNFVRFGSLLETGYGQWVGPAGVAHDRFMFKTILEALNGFFCSKGNTNAWVHYPLAAFSLIGLYSFFRKYTGETLFLSSLVVSNIVAISGFSFWTGEWCYGPRYLLLPLMIGCLPFIQTLRIVATIRIQAIRVPLVLAGSAVLVWSFFMQFYVNSLDYFAWHRITAYLGSANQPRIGKYFETRGGFHRGYFCADLMAFRDRGEEFYPLKILGEVFPPNRKDALRMIEMEIRGFIRPNFYFTE